MIAPDLTRSAALVGELQGPDHPDSRTLQTYGPTVNEAYTAYQVGPGAHRIYVIERMSPDITIGHGARVAAFYRRLGETPVVDSAPRSVRGQVLRCERGVTAPSTLSFQAALVPPPQVSPAVAPIPGSSPFGLGEFGLDGFGG